VVETLNDGEQTHFFKNKWGTYSATLFSPPEEMNTTHPTIIFAHGYRAQKEYYTWIGDCLASQGYFALLFTVPSNRLPNPQQWSDGFGSAIDYLLSKEETLHESPQKIGVMGHSMGGLGALLAGSEDPRIECIVGLAPATLPQHFPILREVYDIQIPILVQIGSKDGIVNPENVKAFFDQLHSKQKSYLEIQGGNHIRFGDRTAALVIGEYLIRLGALGRRFKDGRAGITFEEQHQLSSRSFLECFNQYLKH